MPDEVALLGPTATAAADTLRERTDTIVSIKQIADLENTAAYADALQSARAIVGTGIPEDATLGPNVRLVQNIGAGVDGYDLDRLPDDAFLCNVYGHSRSVAEHAIALTLAVQRHLVGMDAAFREGRDARRDGEFSGLFSELGGDTLGILGHGHIGQVLADIATGFDMDVVAIRRSPGDGEPPKPLSFLGSPDDLEAVLRRSDVVVVALPLTEETWNLIGEPELAMMGSDAILINVARGPIVDEDALFEALESGTIGGAGIDVWYDEPESERKIPSRRPFERLDNVVATPHVAGWSTETWDARWEIIAENIDRVVREEEPVNVVHGSGP